MEVMSQAAGYRAASGRQTLPTVADLRARTVTASTEATTGRIADPVGTLGAANGPRLSMVQAAADLDGIVTANTLLATRMDATQDALGQLSHLASGLTQSLVTAVSGAMTKEGIAGAAETALTSLHSVANTAFGGRPLLGGDRTDAAPLADMGAAAASLEALFDAHFGFGSDDAAAAALSAEDVTTFFTGTALPALTTTVWDTDISRAGAAITARIAPGITVAPGPTVDAEAVRHAVGGALAVAHLAGSNLSQEAAKGVARVGLDTMAQAASDVATLQGELGLDQTRVEQASERLIAQGERLRDSANGAVSLDAFEAAARFAELATQLEAAYTMTTRINQLTLARFLP